MWTEETYYAEDVEVFYMLTIKFGNHAKGRGIIMIEYPSIHLTDSDTISPNKPYLIRHPDRRDKFTVGYVENNLLHLISDIYEAKNLLVVKTDTLLQNMQDRLVFCSRAKAVMLFNEIELKFWKRR
jgi:hypothetical protein